MVIAPTVIYARYDAIDDFANAVVNPRKGLAKELNATISHRLHSPCSTPELLDYSYKLNEITSGDDFVSFDPSVQKRVLLIHRIVSERLKKKEDKFLHAISWWISEGKMNLNTTLLEKVYPGDVDEICLFIDRKARKILEQGSSGGKSVSKEVYTSSGREFVVSFRLRKERLQILIHENMREGRFKIFQKVIVVAGPLVKGAPGPLFARLKIHPYLRALPSVRALVRREAALSFAMEQCCVKNIVHYALISRKRERATLATTLYKEDLLDMLERFPEGPDVPETAYKFLSDIAIPIATALSGLHKSKVVHLDLKPDNIFLSEEGIAYLGDFGTYRQVGWYEKEEITTQAVAAPEVFQEREPQGWKVSTSLDMWAFGLLLVDLFLGPQKNKLRAAWTQSFDPLLPEEKSAYILRYSGEILQDIESCYSYQNDSAITRLMDLISQLLSAIPTERPKAKDVVRELKAIRDLW